MGEVAKPPIGVAPEFIWREQNPNPDGRACRERAFALMDATRRYIAAGLVPRAEWVGELCAVAYEAGYKDAVETTPPLLTLTMPEPTPERKAELEAALASAKSGQWVSIPTGMTLGPQPGPTFESFTADMLAPLNEAGERIGPARERRDEIPCVGYVTGLDAAGKPIIHYTDERFRPMTAEQREARRALIRDVLVPSLAGVAAEVQARVDAADEPTTVED